MHFLSLLSAVKEFYRRHNVPVFHVEVQRSKISGKFILLTCIVKPHDHMYCEAP